MQQFFYTSQGIDHGPVSASDLKKLAASGALVPTDFVWSEGKQRRAAGSVNGLFPSDDLLDESPQKVAEEKTQVDSINPEIWSKVKPILYSWPTIAVMLLTCCFSPIGLVLVWTHPIWETSTKAYWTIGFVMLVFVFGQVGPYKTEDSTSTATSVAEANEEADHAIQEENDSSIDDAVTFKVSKGMMSGKVIVEIPAYICEMTKFSKFDWTKGIGRSGKLEFVQSGDMSPLSYSAYDSDGTLIDGGSVDRPGGQIERGGSAACRIMFLSNGDDVKTIRLN